MNKEKLREQFYNDCEEYNFKQRWKDISIVVVDNKTEWKDKILHLAEKYTKEEIQEMCSYSANGGHSSTLQDVYCYHLYIKKEEDEKIKNDLLDLIDK